MSALAFLTGVSLVLAQLAAPLAGMAQESGKIARIGMPGPLVNGKMPVNDPLVEAFREGLRELGYVDGHNIRIEYRDVAADLVRLGEMPCGPAVLETGNG